MKKVLLIAALVLGFVMTIVGPELPRLGSRAAAPGPQEVVQTFYDEYLAYIGSGETMRNPVVDGMYRKSPHLAASLIAHVDALVANFKDGGFDPFLMAQDVPASVSAGDAVVTEKTALVPVTTSFPGRHFTVRLEKQADGRWLIVAITPGM